MIELEIFHHTEQAASLKDVGIDYNMEDCELRPMTFYQINGVSPYLQQGKEYSEIHANGTYYICPLSYEEVTRKIAIAYKLF